MEFNTLCNDIGFILIRWPHQKSTLDCCKSQLYVKFGQSWPKVQITLAWYKNMKKKKSFWWSFDQFWPLVNSQLTTGTLVILTWNDTLSTLMLEQVKPWWFWCSHGPLVKKKKNFLWNFWGLTCKSRQTKYVINIMLWNV